MPTNLKLDDKLIADAVKLGKHKTKQEAVNSALEEYVAHRNQGNQALIQNLYYRF